MPLIEDDDPAMLDISQRSFHNRLLSGRVVPIVSNRAIFDRMLGGYGPFFDAATLARLRKKSGGQDVRQTGGIQTLTGHVLRMNNDGRQHKRYMRP